MKMPPPLNILGFVLTYIIKLVVFISFTMTRNCSSNTDDGSQDKKPEYVLEKKYAEIFAKNAKIVANDKVDARLKQNTCR